MTTARRTGAIVVAYHPDHDQLDNLISALKPQVEHILIINNGPAQSLAIKSEQAVTIHAMAENVGVGAAINHGVARLLESGFHGALLLDQDSQIGPTLIASLTTSLEQASAEGRAVAAIGPRIRDHDNSNTSPFIRFRLPFNQRLKGDKGVVACDFLITSGCLINLEHWERIGPMRAPWFIDNIDIEWCFRARQSGFEILGSLDVELDHRIGDRERLFGILTYRRHSPDRLYTMMRNRVFLYRSGAPTAFIVQDAIRAVGKLGLFSLIAPRRQHLKAMLAGLRDGFRTRPLP